MKIAMIGQKGVPARFGGVERSVDELSQHLHHRGHEVVVYTRPYFTPRSKKTHHGVRLVSLPSVRTKHLDAISHSFLATLHAIAHRVDIIHYHGVGPSLVAFLPRMLRPSIKVVVTVQCLDRFHTKWGVLARAFLRFGEWTAVRFPHATIAVSHELVGYCRSHYGKTPTYISNGFTMRRFPRNSEAAVLRRFGLTRNGFLLLATRLIPHKGVHYAIEAFRRIRTEKQLVIVGGSFYTDQYEARLKALAHGDPRIRFLGFQNEKILFPLFRTAALFVHPSEFEGMPLTVLEAAGFGCPIVASNIPAHREILRHGHREHGILFPARNVEELRKALHEVLRKPAAARAMGLSAQRYVNDVYHWRTIARDMERLYHSLLMQPFRCRTADSLRNTNPLSVAARP